MTPPGDDPTVTAPGNGSDVEEGLDRLYSVPLEQFTVERDALARALRSHDKEAAARVKSLRRPTVTAWALNRLARDSPGELAALFDADAALARSQREGAGRDRLTQSLSAVAIDQEGREALARGRLTRDLTPSSLWESAPAEVDPAMERRQDLQRRAEEVAAEVRRLDNEAAALEAEADRADRAARAARAAATEARRKAAEAAKRAEEAEQAAGAADL